MANETPSRLVDCPTQLTLMTWICQCSMTNTSEKYERAQQGNLLAFDMIKSTTKKSKFETCGAHSCRTIRPVTIQSV